MRAVGVVEFGGPDALEVVELPDREAGPGEVRIRVRAAAVNPTDTGLRSGARAAQLKDIPPPYVPGMDAAGVLEQIGEGVSTALQPVEHVMAIVVPERLPRRLFRAARGPGRIGGPGAGRVVRRRGFDPAHERPDHPDGARLTRTSSPARRWPSPARPARSAATRCSWRRPKGSGSSPTPPRPTSSWSGTSEPTSWSAGATTSPIGSATRFPKESTGSSTPPSSTSWWSLRSATAAASRQFAAIEGDEERGITFHPVFVRNYAREQAKLDRLRQQVEDGQVTLRVARSFPPSRRRRPTAGLEAGGTRGRLVLEF